MISAKLRESRAGLEGDHEGLGMASLGARPELGLAAAARRDGTDSSARHTSWV